jgi:hypothetical protein
MLNSLVQQLRTNTKLLGLMDALKAFYSMINFERRLSRRWKIALALLVLAMWISAPSAVKLMAVSSHFVNFGIGLVLHACFLYRKATPYLGISLNLGRPITMMLGVILIFSGVALRGGMHWH